MSASPRDSAPRSGRRHRFEFMGLRVRGMRRTKLVIWAFDLGPVSPPPAAADRTPRRRAVPQSPSETLFTQRWAPTLFRTSTVAGKRHSRRVISLRRCSNKWGNKPEARSRKTCSLSNSCGNQLSWYERPTGRQSHFSLYYQEVMQCHRLSHREAHTTSYNSITYVKVGHCWESNPILEISHAISLFAHVSCRCDGRLPAGS
mgnify:CR=1 FL=1